MKKQIKIKPLTSKFFSDLANKIYNPKTKKYIRLCDGLLTNGPDPKNPKRKMHCGLGEMYFAMTGKHTGKLKEADIKKLVMDNLALSIKIKKDELKIRNLIKSLKNINSAVKSEAISAIDDLFVAADYKNTQNDIFNILDDMPANNDNCGGGIYSCNDEGVYILRSQRIAEDFRTIAKKLAVKK